MNRPSDMVDNWVGQIVDQLDCRIGIGKTGMFPIVFAKPVGDINACLEFVRYSVFEFVTEIDLIESPLPYGMLPRHPVLQFEAARRRRIRFVQKREVADATESENCR